MMSPTENRLGQQQNSSVEDDERSNGGSGGEDVKKRTPPLQPAAASSAAVEKDNKKSGDVEKFGGKIVYNPDGSAFIIEDGDISDEDVPVPIRLEGSIVDEAKNSGEEEESGDKKEAKALPQIANAFYISKSTAYYHALYGQAYVKMLQEKNLPDTPVVHSYRVYSARDKTGTGEEKSSEQQKHPLVDYATVPVKPILMCFICKLSFGCGQSFNSHCADGHSLELNEEEKDLLHSKNSSAIIQNVGKEKEPLVSFLEPVMSTGRQKPCPPFSPGAINHLLSAAAAASLPKVPNIPPSSSPSSVSAEDHQQQRVSPLLASTPPALGVASAINPPLSSSSSSRRSPLESSRSPAVSPSANSPSPVTLPPPTTLSQVPTNANMLQGTTIGACPEHVNGRPTGIECSQCDLILNQSRLGGMGWNMSRNSCKTLKCPKCNWHYKYQETLEIHMKEKHPENETTCIYCITGQQHPRLARGETYTCGYKPYRCEVCNYSTTTKGNLSIHMQSDKHLNNMQDLQNGGLVPPSSTSVEPPKLPSSPSSSSRALGGLSSSSPLPSPSKQKASFRCDFCNYETNVARNLRIHNTSEKHTHNMMALQQQSAKNMLSAFPRMPPPGLDPKNLLSGLFGLQQQQPPTSNPSEQAAMADLAYNQAVLAQIMSGGQFPGGPPPPLSLLPPSSSAGQTDLASIFAGAAAAAAAAANAAAGSADDAQNNESPPEPTDPNPKHLFSCCVCRDFGCDTLDELSQHLSQDRSRTRENEVSIFIGGNFLCQLCNYKTNLKANFQLHCKTDKHLQRLSHVNHIKEGGPSNEWKLRFLTSLNPVELRCNACDFVTNSPHKMQVHFGNQQHQVSALLFSHLKRMSEQCNSDRLSYRCSLCQFSAPGKHLLMVHVRSMKHLQMEQMHQLKKRAEGNIQQTEIGDIFQVTEETPATDDESKSSLSITCPLCQEEFDSQDKMESHAMSVHSVNAEGLTRLQSLISESHWLNKQQQKQSKEEKASSPTSAQQSQGEQQQQLAEETKVRPAAKAEFNYSMEKYLDPNRPFKCDVCRESFTQKNILLVHYNSVSHLHRLKKTMQEQQQQQQSNHTEGATNGGGSGGEEQHQQQEKTPTKGSALEALVGSMRGDRNREDEENKAFKCNICKVAYSQGSTLDIHIRSVLHQTKASKLQELILTGQIDLSKPLIEQPDAQQLQEQHKKMLGDMLSPKSMTSTGSTNSQSSPNVRNNQSSSPNRPSSPQSSPLASLLGAANNDGASSSSPEEQSPSTLAMSNLAKTFPFLANLSPTAAATDAQSQGDDEKVEPSPVLKNLLQNYGLEVVKQFNDLHRKKSGEAGEDEGTEDKKAEDLQPQANLAAVQEALHKAMLQAQLQQMNPMLMQMSQLQSLNPLMAMNLHPPLIPPALLKNAGVGADMPAALLAQIQQQKQQQQQPPPLGLLDPKLLAFMAAGRQDQGDPKVGRQPDPKMPFKGATPLPFGQVSPMPDPKALLMQQQPIPNVEQGKRARTRITDEQLKILRSNFDINNSPSEEQLNRMAAQTGLPLKVIKHWFRNTLFKERQKNKDSPYNFNNPPSTKLNLEEYEKTGEPKVTPLKPEDQAEYVQESLKKDEKASSTSSSEQQLKSEPVKSEAEEQNASPTNKVPKLNESSSESSLTLSRLLSSQLGQLPHPGSLLPNFPAFPNVTPPTAPLPPTSHPMPDYLNTLANRMPGEQQPPRANSPQSVSSGKRANRTRFTDYQIKVLQEFFENNAYPKDDDLEYLSKLLSLSPRVIVVWFQNARQKARKIYENQPPASTDAAGSSQSDEEGGRFTRTPGCNYQCKKCLLVFQRYYELIRHQKQHCYKEEDAKRSAQAQKAAAQAAAQFAGNTQLPAPASEDSNSSVNERSVTSPAVGLPNAPEEQRQQELSEMSKDAVNRLFGGTSQFLNCPPFGLLQQQAMQQQQQQQPKNNHDDSDEMDSESLASSPSSKRKLSEDGDADEDGHRDKRLRTTILPAQLDILYQKYQQESNPSRKQLEQIASEVGLRKRVVQVWFQNARARERKGHYIKPSGSQQSQPGLKRSGESDEDQDRPGPPESPFTVSDHIASLIPNSTSAFNLQNSMRKYYEDTMKRFMNDIQDKSSLAPTASAAQDQLPPTSSAIDLSSSMDENFESQDDVDTKNIETDSVNGGGNGGGAGGGNKRFRTQMSGVQVKMMKGIFEVYKTPTMTECSSLGQDIGLQKRVVQVWFQNARAKEKRAKLQLQQATGQEPEGSSPPEECQICNFKYSHKYAIQDHIFTKQHLDNLRSAIESGRYDPESPGHALSQTAAAIQGGQGSNDAQATNSSLQMLQMATTQVNNRELLDTVSSHQNPRMLMQV